MRMPIVCLPPIRMVSVFHLFAIPYMRLVPNIFILIFTPESKKTPINRSYVVTSECCRHGVEARDEMTNGGNGHKKEESGNAMQSIFYQARPTDFHKVTVVMLNLEIVAIEAASSSNAIAHFMTSSSLFSLIHFSAPTLIK